MNAPTPGPAVAAAADAADDAVIEVVVDVVVIGAGVAGLVVAERLTAAGLRVVTLEARDRVGGRTLSRPVAGGQVDLGATWFWPGETAVLEYAQRLGLALLDQATDGDAMVDAGRPRAERVRGNPIDVAAFRFGGGAQALASGLAASLPAGTVCVGEPVRRIEYATGEPVRVRTDGRVLACDHVVLALPPAAAAAAIEFDPLLPSQLASLARTTSVWMGQAVKAVAVYDRPFWREAGLAGAALSYRGPFREFHDASGPAGKPAAIFAVASSADFQLWPDPDVDAVFVAQLVHLFGDQASRPMQVLASNWATEPETSPVAGANVTARSSGFGHPLFQDPTAGRIHWSSTETATSYAGHIEGAIRAGLRAATAVLAATGSAAPAPLTRGLIKDTRWTATSGH